METRLWVKLCRYSFFFVFFFDSHLSTSCITTPKVYWSAAIFHCGFGWFSCLPYSLYFNRFKLFLHSMLLVVSHVVSTKNLNPNVRFTLYIAIVYWQQLWNWLQTSDIVSFSCLQFSIFNSRRIYFMLTESKGGQKNNISRAVINCSCSCKCKN